MFLFDYFRNTNLKKNLKIPYFDIFEFFRQKHSTSVNTAYNFAYINRIFD